MSNNRQKCSLLEVIPSSFCKLEQVARWRLLGGESPTYTLRRQPVHLQEINTIGHLMGIWREDNGTLTFVSPRGTSDTPADDPTFLSLTFCDMSLHLKFTGCSHDAVAETAAYFINLEEGGSKTNSLFYLSGRCEGLFDFCAAGPHCVTRVFEAAPARRVALHRMLLSAEQATVLATRSDPVQLTFSYCRFTDEGTVFVDAIERRSSLER